MAFKNKTHQFLCMVLAILFLVSVALLLACRDHELSMKERHEQWMARHGRVYKDEVEKAMRFKIFKDNVKHIESFNKNNGNKYKYTLGVNRFTDLTKEEFQATRTGYYTKSTPSYPSIDSQLQTGSPIVSKTFLSKNVSVDWRERGAVTDVKDQGTCGCAWAFSTVAAIEGMNQLSTGDLVSLSEQQLLDCVTANNGCHGGSMGAAYQYVQQNGGGITTEDSYPYTAMDGNTCQAQSLSSTAVTISGFKDVTADDQDALLETVAKQPVSVGIDAGNFQQYQSGVFNGPCGYSLNHAVTLVGYGTTDDGTNYWLIKNSWGTTWGEEGYMRIQRNSGVGGGLCGLAEMASYPIPPGAESTHVFPPLPPIFLCY